MTTDDVATPGAITEAHISDPEGVARASVDTREEDAVIPDPNARGSRRLLLGATVALVLATLFGEISASGIWEPHELRVADLARRIAATLLGGKALVIVGGVNTVPTAGELGRGELPFTSIALGLRVFGLSEWAGRLPMALWGLLGVLAAYFLVSRLVDRAAAAFTAVILVTSPVYFLQSRTMLGEIVAMAALAIATAGLGLALFDTRLGPKGRAGCWFLGLVGMAAGLGARGALIGVALPAASAAMAWLVRRSQGAGRGDRLAAILVALTSAFAVAAAVIGVRALFATEDHRFSRALGATMEVKYPRPTFDAVVLELGHAFFPWSAVAPLALGRILRPPPVDDSGAFERESSARLLLLFVCVIGFGVYGSLAASTGVLPFGPVFALAAVIALALRDFERGAPGSRSLALSVVAFLVLLFADYKNFPEKGLVPFGIDDAKFPDSFKDVGTRLLGLGAIGSGALFALFFLEREEGQRIFVRDDYLAWPKTLRHAFDGNVAFGLAAMEVVLAAGAAVVFVSDRFTHWAQVSALALPARQVAQFGFLALPVVLAIPTMGLLARDICRFVLRKLHVSRGSAALASVATCGAVLSFVYYPTLAKQISPKEVFESYKRFSHPGEELAMIGAGTGGARYYAHRDVPTFSSPQEGFSWLTGDQAKRRWLVVRAADIAQINSLYRARRDPPKNIPVLDARSSEILLVSNQLAAGETNANPFSKWLLESRPNPKRHVDADFNGQLHAIGWDVTTEDGESVKTVRAGKHYLFYLYYEVTRSISGEWQTFIHIDGYQRRYNGDHDTFEGKYPFHLLRPSDFVVDIHPFELEPNFTAGTYGVYFGLFHGDQRLHVVRGGQEDDRVNAGPLVVE